MTPQERLAAILAVPVHRALGLELLDPDDPAAGAAVTLDEMALNAFGILHGGLVPLLLDVAGYLAVIGELGPEENAVTVNVSASLLTGARAGERIEVRGRLDRRGRRLLFASATATRGQQVIATGQLVKAIVPV